MEKGLEIRPVILGQFGPPTLACIRSWGRQGFVVGMICIRSKGETLPGSKYLADFTTIPPDKLYTLEGMQIISEFLKKFRASGIVCIAERIACWINDHRQMLPTEVAIWLPSNNIINDLISKLKQIEIARKVGFNVLPTYFIDKDFGGYHSIPSTHFPLCLRPDIPRGVEPVFKAHLVYSHDELKKYVSSLMEISQPIIAQPFRNLPNLVVHGARTILGESIGLQAFLVERKFEMVTLTIRPTNLEKDLEKKCIDFTTLFNVTGNYHFEFLIDKADGSTYFLELNNRLGGTTAKVYACGYDEPLLALQAYGVLSTPYQQRTSIEQKPTSNEQRATSNKNQATGNQQPSTSNYRLKNKIVSSKQALLKYLYYTLMGRITCLDYPPESNLVRMAKAIYGFLGYRDDVFMFQDIRGSIAYYFGNLRKRVSSGTGPIF